MTSAESSFAAVLREFRVRANLSQEALALRAAIGKDTVSGLERGSRKYPYAETVSRLAVALALDSGDRRRLEMSAKRPGVARRPVIKSSQPRNTVPQVELALESIPLVGREAAITHVLHALRSNRLVTLAGTGGIGKTRIAREVGAALAGTYDHGIIFVELAPLKDPAPIEEILANAFGIDYREGGLDAILAYLQRRRMLIILDNCEHLINAVAPLAKAVLASSRDVTILATSRERLQIAGEQVYRLPSFTLPPVGGSTPEQILASEAGRFFRERARAARHCFDVTPESAPLIALLCHRLDGIPLALEFAAAFVDSFGVADILEFPEWRFRTFVSGDRMALGRHRNMHASIDWSFDLLSDAERALFVRLACFSGAWSSQAAGVVCRFGDLADADFVALLSSLVNKSMVAMEFVGERARYRLIESTRAYALEKLAMSDDRAEVARRLAYWVAEFADRSRKALHVPTRADWRWPTVE